MVLDVFVKSFGYSRMSKDILLIFMRLDNVKILITSFIIISIYRTRLVEICNVIMTPIIRLLYLLAHL